MLFYPIGRLDARALGDLHDAVRRLGQVPGARRVVSLLDFLPARFATRAELERCLREGTALERFRTSLDWYRLARGLTLARDGSHVGLLVLAAPGALPALEVASADIAGARWLGYPVTERRILALVRSSNRVFVPVALAGGTLVLWLFLRRRRLVAIAAASVFAPLVWLAGTMGWCGQRLNTLSTMLLPITLTTALTATMYVINGALDADPADGAAFDRHMRENVWRPQILCFLTTALGFASLLFAPVPMLQRFGFWACAGCALTLAAALAIPRAGLALAHPGRVTQVERMESGIAALASRLVTHPRVTAASWVALLAIASLGVLRLTPASSASQSLVKGDPLARAIADHERLFAGSTTVELGYRPRALAASHPEGILYAQELQRVLGGDPLVDSTLSVADVHLDAGSRISGRRLDRLQSPREAELYAGWLDGPGGFVSADGLHGRILIRLRTDEAFAMRAFARRALARLAASPHAPAEAFVTGLQHASAIVHAEGVESSIWALFGSLLGGLAALAIVFRSPLTALIAAVPNAVPLLLVYGGIGWLGIPLDVAAALVGPVVYGMIVDDTLHLLHRLRAEVAGGAAPRDAIVSTVARLGRTVVAGSLALAAGLGLSAAAPFALARSFGLTAAATVLVALACELALTPFLIALVPGVLYSGPRDK